jgi:GWxTD domain-containing protein
MKTLVALLLTAALVAPAAAAVDPAAALDAAKKQIAAEEFDAALAGLLPAIDAAAKIADPATKTQALTALHFYAAVAYSGLNREEAALSHLDEALRLTPTMHAIDSTRYSARFVALFNRARGEEQNGRSDRFGDIYPAVAANANSPLIPYVGGDEPAVEFLGSRAEKRQWRSATTPSARAAFIETFWAGRDATPGTSENEFRDTFLRRVAFADGAFGTFEERGALSDRGRVFALLGEPALVRRRALSARDAARVQSFSRGSSGIEVGTVEYWIYRRDQLTIPQAQPTVTFRFISHQGVGSFVLQKDGLAINTLTATANASRRE